MTRQTNLLSTTRARSHFSLCRAIVQNSQVLHLAKQTIHTALEEHLHRKFHNPGIAGIGDLTKIPAA
jgi:hypothetical protein